MKIIITPKEIMHHSKYDWEKFCKIKMIYPWAVKDNLIDENQEFILTKEEATTIGILIT